MKKTLFANLAALIIAGSLFMVSCGKDQDLAAGGSDPSARAGAAQNPLAKASEADKSFDKAVQQIMGDMMQEMKKMEMTCDPDIDFAGMMIMHHEAGIGMADAELQYGHEAEAKALAQKTKEGNQASIERLEAFLAAHPTAEPLSAQECKLFMKEMEEAMHHMMDCMKKAPDSEDVDVDFARQMICHHQGAIDMSEVELKRGNDEAALSESILIIVEQSQEITELSAFIHQHGQ